MRVLVMILAMILISAPVVFAQGTTACPPGTTAMTTSPDAVDVCMMQCFQISRQQITQLREQGWSDQNIAMAAAISQRANVPISQVISDYRANPNWQAVASKYNLSMSDLMSMPSMLTAQDEELFNQMFISCYYSIPVSDVRQLRMQGHSWSSINMMANAAAQTRQPITTIANLRSQGMSWNDIASRYNVPVASLTSPTRTVAMVTTRPAVIGAGPTVPPLHVFSANGGILLSQDQAMRFYAQGYDWLEVAIVANISRESGIPMEQLLPRLRTGTTLEDLVNNTGVDPCSVLNVTNFPFERISIFSAGRSEERLAGLLRCYGCADPCAPVCPPAPCP